MTMNSKGVLAVKDEQLCMKCLKKKATHTYTICGRGYDSYFDDMETKFQCCDDCDEPEYDKWFNEKGVIRNGYADTYQYEDDIWNLVSNLPLESRELFENRFNKRCCCYMNPQDWIDFDLGELPHKKCKEYGLYSQQDKKAYNTRFTTCGHVVNVTWSDNSKAFRCPFGASGDYEQKIDENGNLSDECTDCKFYVKRESPIKEIKGEDLNAWKCYMKAKLNRAEYEKKFG